MCVQSAILSIPASRRSSTAPAVLIASTSASEAARVLELCAGHGIPCEMLTVKVGAGNLQEQARLARYRALAEWVKRRQLTALATAHHADDQAETLVMRLNRASGVAGLAGVLAAIWPARSAPTACPTGSWRRPPGSRSVEPAVPGQFLRHVHILTSTIVPPPGQSLRILVRQRRTHRLHHGAGNKVFRSNQFEAVVLALHLFLDGVEYLGVVRSQHEGGI